MSAEEINQTENKSLHEEFENALMNLQKRGKQLREAILEAIQLGKNAGMPDLVIGEKIRHALSSSMSDRSIRMYLPDELKNQSKHAAGFSRNVNKNVVEEDDSNQNFDDKSESNDDEDKNHVEESSTYMSDFGPGPSTQKESIVPTEKPTIVPEISTPVEVSDRDPEIDRDTELEDLRRENKEIRQQIKVLESKLTGTIKIRLDLGLLPNSEKSMFQMNARGSDVFDFDLNMMTKHITKIY
ncbi:MAG TPA: hypothetical protein VH500_01750 [Nitrososphaeraceae archaeon]|jgi:hypothetical protein